MEAKNVSSKVTEALNTILEAVQELKESDAGMFMTDPTTSEAIKAVLVVEKEVELAKKMMVSRLTEQALKYDPNFKGIQGNGVRASYKATGSAFTVSDSLAKSWTIEGVPPYLKVAVSVDSQGLKDWQKANGGVSVLPVGIMPVIDRKMSLAFSLAKTDDED